TQPGSPLTWPERRYHQSPPYDDSTRSHRRQCAPSPHTITRPASAASPRDAARIANAVANAFLARQRSFELRRVQAARARLVDAMARLRGTPGSRGEIALIRERLSELSVSEANAGSELQLAEAAEA